jgi:purine-binding chemotaxis protein CheW
VKELEAGSAILVFAAGDRKHSVPVRAVEKVELSVEVTALPDAPHLVVGVINWRGRILPVVSLRRRLGLAERPVSADDRLIVIRSARRPLALLVDEVLGVARLSERGMVAAASLWEGIGGIAGAATIEGDVALIHDVDQFLSASEDAALASAVACVPGGAG